MPGNSTRPRMDYVSLRKGFMEMENQRARIHKLLVSLWVERGASQGAQILPSKIASILSLDEASVVIWLKELEQRNKVFIQRRSGQIINLHDPRRIPPEEANTEKLKATVTGLRKQCDEMEAEYDDVCKRLQTERNKRLKAEEELAKARQENADLVAAQRSKDARIKELETQVPAGEETGTLVIVPASIIAVWNELMSE